MQAETYGIMEDMLGETGKGITISNPLDYIRIGEKGVSPSFLVQFMERFSLDGSTMADLVGVSMRTLFKWIKSDKSLTQNYSIKVLEMADLFLYGESLFKSREDFLRWIGNPNTALGGMVPARLMSMPEGLSKVRNLLGRIEYGVYS